MDNEYKGISFPFRIGGRGGIVMSGQSITGQEHRKERLKVLLGTRKYERVMRPANGLVDLDIFFNDLNETTKNMAIFRITETIEEFEPEITVMDIDIQSEDQVDGSVAHIITITYAEPETGNVESLALQI